MSYRIERLNGSTATISNEEAGELAMTFHGDLLAPGDPGYEEARVVQNAMIDRQPGLIVRCSGAADVMDAVELARDRGLKTSVRGGGHSVAGHCVSNDGLMIDLSEMRGVWVDPEERRVRVEAGATWGDVDRETQQFGLAVPGGVVSTTGVAGLTLGGGIGWLHRKYGLACDNLRSVELVTPDGELVRASEEENGDLFWGVRGGGGNFGVVTSFEFEARPVGPIVMCGSPFYPIEAAEEVFPRWRDWTETVPEEVTSRAVFWSMPEDEHLPPEVWNRDVLVLGALYAGPPEEGEEVIQPIREFGRPLADVSGRMPYRMFQQMLDPFFPKGELASYWKSTYLGELTDEAVEYVRRRAQNRPNGGTMVHVPMMGGAVSRMGPEETAFGDRSARYMLSLDGNWTDPAEAETVIEWVRQATRGAEELEMGGGTYLNFSGDDPGESVEAVEAAYGENLPRLRELKAEYDPDNLFRLNNNITPAT